MKTVVEIPLTFPTDLSAIIHSHGWYQLLPNVLDAASGRFSRVEKLPGGQVVRLSITVRERAKRSFQVDVEHAASLSDEDIKIVRRRVRRMFRLEEDLNPFYALCASRGEEWNPAANGTGLLLRSPEIFEDMVKVLCTTNIQWGGTKRMVSDLVSAFGAPFPGGDPQKCFPAPEDICSEAFELFSETVRLGYRARYVYDLASAIAEGDIDLYSFEDAAMPTENLRRHLLRIKGIGNYAAATMLMLLGRYDFLPVDTVFRDFMQSSYFGDRPYDQAQALAHFAEWGQWKALAYWLEMGHFYQRE